jgi:hypothetical protein
LFCGVLFHDNTTFSLMAIVFQLHAEALIVLAYLRTFCKICAKVTRRKLFEK